MHPHFGRRPFRLQGYLPGQHRQIILKRGAAEGADVFLYRGFRAAGRAKVRAWLQRLLQEVL